MSKSSPGVGLNGDEMPYQSSEAARIRQHTEQPQAPRMSARAGPARGPRERRAVAAYGPS
ncbi:hypothetical protein ACH4RA_17510 [Streptomyces smyrnaeus]|uniref:hypothetical protein n=1 Tax=Streptomyces TaxID=1883 RepID=UPI001180F464|nr:MULTISPECIES: hypothetical protein [unclassified Streptomyces]MBQ0863864.1 hypothetical protein [Streptomyces sp. RK75]MBQ1123976.1 hypothetical protein [Streptomyces sp. B15]MBQ1157962.1 hypothetical protein [Streptomyces sp. A73]